MSLCLSPPTPLTLLRTSTQTHITLFLLSPLLHALTSVPAKFMNSFTTALTPTINGPHAILSRRFSHLL